MSFCRELYCAINTSDTDPLLSVAVFQVVNPFVVPQHSDPQQVHGEEAVFSQDHKVREEPGCGLHHTDLSVGYADEPLVHQFVCFGVPGLSLHDVALSCFVSQGDGRDLGDKKGEKISKLCTEIHKEISKSVEKSAPCQFPGRYTGW